jgi:hypothetical protein
MNTVYFPVAYFKVPWPRRARADYQSVIVGTELRHINIHSYMRIWNKSLNQGFKHQEISKTLRITHNSFSRHQIKATLHHRLIKFHANMNIGIMS